MPSNDSGIHSEFQEPKGWRELVEKAQRERNPKKLDTIIQKVNRLLTEHERRNAL